MFYRLLNKYRISTFCISQGKTREEALANIEEAISLYIEVLQDRGEPIPDDTVEVVLV